MATIVVTDDDEAMRNAIVRVLQREGHKVLAFEDAAPALDAVNFEEVGLFITDLQMPTLGEQFILILREKGVDVPVIVISAFLSEDRTRYLKDLGVHQVLEKPFQLSQLLRVMKELMKSVGKD